MDGFKKFYNEKKGKHILFFGFYIIFFVFLAIYISAMNSNRPINNNKEGTAEKEITTYDLSKLINDDYEYKFVIVDYEDDIDESVTFEGTKNNIDYANYKHKYFLDIYNVNQLLKRSKLISSQNLLLTYNLENKELNDILLTQKEDGVNKIEVYVNENAQVHEIILDLSNYFGKEMFRIEMFYTEVDNNENSPS